MNAATRRVLIGLLYGDVCEAEFARIDPGDLFQASVRQQVEAHVLWRLANLTFSDARALAARERLAAGLQQWCIRNAAMNLRRDAAARPILKQMDQRGIRVMLLKGTALRTRYRELAGRPQCDTDVMVSREDLDRAEQVLMEAGYEADNTFMTREEYLAGHVHLRLKKGDDVIELHWTMSNECADGALERIWARAELIDWGGAAAWLPSAEDELVFTQAHLARHLFMRGLRWIADLLFQVERGPRLGASLDTVRRDWPLRLIDASVVVAEGLSSYDYPYVIATRECGTWLDRRILCSLTQALLLNQRWYGLEGWHVAPALTPWLWCSKGGLMASLLQRLGQLVIERLLRREAEYAPEPFVG